MNFLINIFLISCNVTNANNEVQCLVYIALISVNVEFRKIYL